MVNQNDVHTTGFGNPADFGSESARHHDPKSPRTSASCPALHHASLLRKRPERTVNLYGLHNAEVIEPSTLFVKVTLSALNFIAGRKMFRGPVGTSG